MIKEKTFKTLVELGNKVSINPSEENIKEFSDILHDFSDLSKITCKHCKHFTNKVDNGNGSCSRCLYHYIRYSDHNFEKTPLNFELKK